MPPPPTHTHHDLSRVVDTRRGVNGSLLLLRYVVALRIERVLQLKLGVVTPDDPTEAFRPPVSQLLAELKPIFAAFQRFSAVRTLR